MTYNVFSGTLNPTQSQSQLQARKGRHFATAVPQL